MAATDLSFSKNEENKYVASFVSEGPVTIQVKRQEAGALNIYANIDGMVLSTTSPSTINLSLLMK